MYKIIFVIILIFILFVINLYSTKEHFNICQRYDKCSKHNGETYSQCYNTGECTVMIDLLGNTFCTSNKA